MFGTQPYEVDPSTALQLPVPQKPVTPAIQSLRSRPISLTHISNTNTLSSSLMKTSFAEHELVFSLEVLRSPLVKLSKTMKQKVALLKRRHKQVDNEFLEKRVEPRLIVIVADGHNMKVFKKQTHKSWEPRQYSNVTININKYIAKYDYDIAQLICPSNAKRLAEDESNFRKAAIYEIL